MSEEPHVIVDRRQSTNEVLIELQRIYAQGEQHLKADKEFHDGIQARFYEYFGDFEGMDHKKHHTWVAEKITIEEAKAAFYDKIKLEMIKNALLILGGAVLMYIAVATWNSVTHDVVKAGTQTTTTQQQTTTQEAAPTSLPAAKR